MADGFIERHGLWSDEQSARAEEIKNQVEADGIRLIRMVWADTHGHARAKLVSVPVFLTAQTEGYTINVATFTLDATGGRVFQCTSAPPRGRGGCRTAPPPRQAHTLFRRRLSPQCPPPTAHS